MGRYGAEQSGVLQTLLGGLLGRIPLGAQAGRLRVPAALFGAGDAAVQIGQFLSPFLEGRGLEGAPVFADPVDLEAQGAQPPQLTECCLLEESLVLRFDRSEDVPQRLQHLLEIGGVVGGVRVGEGELAGAEAVLEGIAAGAGLAFGRPRSGGFFCVAAVGAKLRFAASRGARGGGDADVLRSLRDGLVWFFLRKCVAARDLRSARRRRDR